MAVARIADTAVTLVTPAGRVGTLEAVTDAVAANCDTRAFELAPTPPTGAHRGVVRSLISGDSYISIFFAVIA